MAGDHRAFLAKADGSNAHRINAERNHEVTDRTGAALTQCKVVFERAALVAMAFNDDSQFREIKQTIYPETNDHPRLARDRRTVKGEMNNRVAAHEIGKVTGHGFDDQGFTFVPISTDLADDLGVLLDRRITACCQQQYGGSMQ